MGASYIPENVYAICTFQTDAEPRKFLATRSEISVFYDKDKKHPLLTVADKNIDKQFPCKSPKNAMWSFLCFGAGLLVGLALLSNPVGWVVATICIATAVASIGYGIYKATQINHSCTGALSAGCWKIAHTKVRFNKEYAITQNSMLLCDAGGVLTPIFSYNIALTYGQNIVNNNNKEIGLNAIASFLGGVGMVLAGAEAFVAGSWPALGKVGLWIMGTTTVVNVGAYGETELIRNTSLEDNEHYQDMNEEVDKNSLSDLIPDKDFTPGDLSSPDILELDEKGNLASKDGSRPIFFNGKWYVQDWQKNLIEIKQGTALAEDLSALDGVDAREVWKTAEGKAIVENIRQGKYSADLVKTALDGNNVVRPRNLPNLAKELPEIKTQNIKNIGKLGVKGGSFIAFAFPFIATYFSENSRKELVTAMVEDANNGINIIANNP